MKKLLIIFTLILVIVGCEQSSTNNYSNEDSLSYGSNYVNIKYRDDDVDISSFEELGTSSSTWVNGAWYDEENEYMVINLEGIYYHYCELPEDVWNDFEESDSFGSYYSTQIKGDYDCRLNYVPSY